MELTEFWTICSSNGIILDLEQLNMFTRYFEELKYWNQRVNLISRKEEDKIFQNHILHSLTILKYIEIPERAKCLDVGTGGGFPGIPLKIARQDLHFTLVDSISKKVKITDMFAKHTGLKNIETICERTENLYHTKKYQYYFDFVFSRAVTKLDVIIEWVDKLIKTRTKIVVLKGGDLSEEIRVAKSKFPALIVEEIPINLLGADWFLQEDKKILIAEFTR